MRKRTNIVKAGGWTVTALPTDTDFVHEVVVFAERDNDTFRYYHRHTFKAATTRDARVLIERIISLLDRMEVRLNQGGWDPSPTLWRAVDMLPDDYTGEDSGVERAIENYYDSRSERDDERW